MTDKTLYDERVELFDNAFHQRKNKRTPLFSNFWTWKLLDNDYSLRAVLEDYELLEKTVSDFQERYNFDSHFDLGTRNPVRVTNILGNAFHKIDDKNDSIYVEDHVVMLDDEYPDFINDRTRFYWSKVFARLNPDLSLSRFRDACAEYVEFSKFSAKITSKFVEKYQCVPVSPIYLKQPFEYFFGTLRGIKASSMDLRRRRGELDEALEIMYQTAMLPVLDKVLKTDTSMYMCDAYTSFMGWSTLNDKQFSTMYWPYFERIFSRLIDNDKKLFLMSEASMLRFADYFADVPKGRLMIQLEVDDVFEIHSLLPDISIAGGMNTDLLGKGTKQQCIDRAKMLIDGMGEGFVLSQNKMVSFRNDCKRENLLALNEFVLNYAH